jgi:hypothetical protein
MMLRKSSWSLVVSSARTLKTLTACGAKEDVWTHDAIPTPKRLPIFGTTLDIIASGSAKK